MSKYSTGELAKLCGVTVRTVQFYDQRGLLIPSALTEGGRRLYSEDDLKKMKIICFLRDTGLSLDTIGKLNWTSFVLGVVIVGLEAGWIYAYQAGWQVSTGFIVQSAFLAAALLLVGYFLYHEALTWNKLAGVAVCLAGLVIINLR